MGFPDMGGFIVTSVTSFPHQQDNRLSRRRLPIMLRLRLAFLGRPDMGIVDNYHSLFTFSSSSWVVLIWLVSLPLQSLRSLTGKTTDSSPGCSCGRYRFLTSKATASICIKTSLMITLHQELSLNTRCRMENGKGNVV